MCVVREIMYKHHQRRCLHDTDRVSFRYCTTSSRPHTEYLYLVYRIPWTISFQNAALLRYEFISVVAPDRNFHSGMKSGRTFHKYHVKEVQAHPDMELGTWIGWADQLTRVFDLPMFLPHFHSFYV